MASRGWQRERVVWCVDTNGVRVPVITGVTTDQKGRLVGALAIGDSPSAVLDQPVDGSVHGQIVVNAMSTLLDVEELQARQDREHGRGGRA